MRRLLRALPGPRLAAGGSLAWAAAMAASALWHVWQTGWRDDGAVAAVALLAAAGGLLAFVPAHAATGLLSAGRGHGARVAAAVLSFAVLTAGLTAALFALHYRLYYAAWHAEAFTVEWAFQFAFTTANAGYQFAVLGLRLYLPIGLAALLAVSFLYARLPR
ncbi:hypothetical protein N1F89_16730 [Aquibium sp. A9E412]|uniref:hypothetical protein n=1 Tax=Aquibium sp. A9E412 TaxID=2976767 RepID=UPI0025B0EAEE|nr:hypothetical protein [Aquibium sp. A9E412]MDN2567870.1 hypothetical protein [Aquibium sp. A9E412]